ncbi:hypothetical protein PUV54_00810 [Hyphococcus flavus]|uniref:Uncharacterized protein n=1 Tax=Hyphococcus flavus TaxID=1866326 RepID=A0AAE9ZF50_9PROT|nr:hypothetical protein [Hyphococcus flavus]WDI31728.1 hypothetical protein PUV54_00810 [Hyphococcus flavus]
MKPHSKKSNTNAFVACLAGGYALAGAAVGQIAAPETVETAQLATDAFAIGALKPGEPALQPSLWQDSEPQTLDFLLSHAPTRPNGPSMGLAMRRILLSPGQRPAGADASLGGKKLLALVKAGFIEEAQTIASLATSGRNNASVAEAQAVIGLLTGNFDNSCRRDTNLASGRDALFWVRLRAFCYARAGEFDAFDLTVNLLRERGAFSPTDEAYLTSMLSAAAGAAPDKTLPPAETALHYAAAEAAGLSLNPLSTRTAEGGVVAALAQNPDADPAMRIEATQQAIAMGVTDAGELARMFNTLEFDVANIAGAAEAAVAAPADPLSDALLYQAISAMNAPEFIRDKAARVSQALELADSFHRAYSLSLLYADDIEALEGVLVAPTEASSFAMARMAVGDSVGAGRWLLAMIGANESVAALPEPVGLAFIDRVNLLALLDPQTAAQVARQAGVAILTEDQNFTVEQRAHVDSSVTARILEAAFNAVGEGKVGQAGLAALAASAGKANREGEVERVIISETLKTAGLPELQRRHAFERAWAARLSGRESGLSGGDAASSSEEAGGETPTPVSTTPRQDEEGLIPRIKPSRGE